MKIIGSVWFTAVNSIGIVLGEDELTKERKAYIEVASGLNEKADAEHIAKHGAIFPAEIAKQLVCGLGKVIV